MQKAELEKRVTGLLQVATDIEVKDNETLNRANIFVLNIKALKQEIDSVFDPIIDAANRSHKEAIAQKKKFEEPLTQARRIMDPKIAAYLEEQRRIFREAEEAKRRAEEERRRLEEEAMRKAREIELRAQREQDEKKRQEAQAKISAILNKAAEAEKKITEAIPKYVEPPKTQDISMRENWSFRIIYENAIPREYLIPDMIKLGAIARTMKDKTNIPGIEAYKTTSIVTRRQ